MSEGDRKPYFVPGRSSMDLISKISQELNTGFDSKCLTAIADLLAQGYSPESIVSLIQGIQKEKANISINHQGGVGGRSL